MPGSIARFIAYLLFGGLLKAQTAYQELRYEEDWSYLRDPQKQSDFWDPIKYVPLNDQGWYVSIGGESRVRYEFFRYAGFGSVPNSPHGFVIQRYLLHSDFHFGPHVRMFIQFQSGLENGRVTGPRLTDEDKAELHQAFIDISTSEDSKKNITFRLGRQEFEFGSGHYLSVSEVFNVRRSFDGVRIFGKVGSWTWNVLAAHPVETNPGPFDDSPDHTQTIWATGVFGPHPLFKDATLSFYYLSYDRKLNRFDQGAAHEIRNTAGSRSWGKIGNKDFNYEMIFQWGSFGNKNIRAFALTTESGYNWSKSRFAPRAGFRFDIVSGDRNPNGSQLNTFNPLFPTTAYSGRIGLIGASNVIDLTPNGRIRLNKRVFLLPENSVLFRESLKDGVYGVTGALSRTGKLSNARFIGNQASLPMVVNIDRHLSWTAAFSRFYSGAFLKQTPPGHSVSYFTTFLQYRF